MFRGLRERSFELKDNEYSQNVETDSSLPYKGFILKGLKEKSYFEMDD